MRHEKNDHQTMLEDFRTGDGRTVHSWAGRIFERFSLYGGIGMEKKENQGGVGKAKTGERQIIKEQGGDGIIVYRYSDFQEEVNDCTFSDASLDCRFSLIMERFKLFLDLIGNTEESCRLGIVLGPLIKEAESELQGIADFISHSIGEVGVLYHEECRFMNFQDRSVTGIILKPSSETR